MKTIKYLFLLSFFLVKLSGSAQIGYQVSLLNNATGEPRANERVNVTVKIMDSEGNTVCEEMKNMTSNDFGVISMSVGDNDTFANADWSKLPFFIEASADGRLIGKSQLLSVPVAEYAKQTGILTKEILCSKNWRYDDIHFIFQEDGKYIYDETERLSGGVYFIDGNDVILFYNRKDEDGDSGTILKYFSEMNASVGSSSFPVYK